MTRRSLSTLWKVETLVYQLKPRNRQKLLNLGTQAPVSVEYILKIVCACANDDAPEICALQQNAWYERNTY